MMCLRCKDVHVGREMALADRGVSFALGDCPRSGGAHEWRKANFVTDLPLIPSPGDYRVRKVTLEEAVEFVHAALVTSCLTLPRTSQFLSAILDMPLIYRDGGYMRLDIGDRMLSPVYHKTVDVEMDLRGLALGKDFDLFITERIA